MKLHDKTPPSFLHFASGTLPAEALVHLRALGLFGMICRLPGNILHRIAEKSLLMETSNSKSWFVYIRELCAMYELPTPLLLLTLQWSKDKFKNTAKSKVISYWESNLRVQAASKSSLK